MTNEEPNVAKAHQELATRNAQVAVKVVSEVKVSMTERMNRLEGAVGNLQNELSQLQLKYNLLLTKNFNGGSTSGDNS